MEACPFSGEVCTTTDCAAWGIAPGLDDKTCLIIAGAVASIVLADRRLKRMPPYDEDED